MTKEELLALGLTDEQVAKIVDDQGRYFVTKARFNEVIEDRKALRAEVAELKGELEDARTAPKTELEALQKQVEKLTKQNEAEAKARKEAEERERNADIRRQTVEALTLGNASNPAEIAKILTQDITVGEDGSYVYKTSDGKEVSIQDGVKSWLKENLWAVTDNQRSGSGIGGKPG